MNEEQRRELGDYALRRLARRDELTANFWDEAARRLNMRLTGGAPGRIPLPIEVNHLLEEANRITRHSADMGGIPYCAVEPPGDMAGERVFCKLAQGHTEKIKHRDPDIDYSWWGGKQ